MNIWLRQHWFALKSAFTHLRAAPGNFIFNVLVVAVALALPIAGLTLIENLLPVSEQLSIEPEISVFLKTDLVRSDATALSIPIKKMLKEAQVSAKLNFVPKEKALAALGETSSLAEVLSSLGGNPLPDAYVISLSNTDARKVEPVAEQLRTLDGIETVQVDSAWVKRLAALVQILQISLLFLAITLSIVVVVVIFNTTRLQVISHQAEISVAKLLGATKGFIHRPYYYTGGMLGLLAGCLSLGMIAVALHPLNQAIADFAKLYASEFHLSPLGVLPSLGVLGICLLLGWAAAFLSVRRQLAKLR